jgi:hypothetical protein
MTDMKFYTETRVIHVPVSRTAYLVDVLLFIFLMTVFIAANRSSHSVSDMLYAVFPYVVPTFLLREWFAAKSS